MAHRAFRQSTFAALLGRVLLNPGCTKKETVNHFGDGSGGGGNDATAPAAGVDDDGDGLEDRLEFLGWEIVVDEFG
ncbi:MAG: hypothetical protein EXS13_11800 [Planctomycetes bacterium]|nr:hypothetical protein [Planctomycetota bacterium]